MSTFVLVHGAWHGSWCYARVRTLLQQQGHSVFTPTLTGVGERSHLMSRSVNLSTHVDDIVNLLEWEELGDAVLVGHSYGGFVISGAAERLPERIRHLVYLDAFLPNDGERLLDIVPQPFIDAFYEGANKAGEGYRIPPIPAATFNVNEADRALVDRKCTPHPLAAFEERIAIKGKPGNGRPATYILATNWEGTPFPPMKERARRLGWRTVDIACGHDVMLDRPAELAAAVVSGAL
jgi:pimeloyl-ACP methyl ester carboxylesterase